MGKLITVLVVLAIAAGATWYTAGKAEGPAINIAQPTKVIGQGGDLALVIDTPKGKLASLNVVIEQGGKQLPVFNLAGGDASQLKSTGEDQVSLQRPIGKRQIADLEAG